VLQLLQQHDELSVGRLVEHLNLPQPQVSKHLACLRWCGFVETRRDHRRVYYRLGDSRVVELLELGGALLTDNADHVAACGTIDGAPC
jgi:DNA-binding transcriptional ArsR family regulator